MFIGTFFPYCFHICLIFFPVSDFPWFSPSIGCTPAKHFLCFPHKEHSPPLQPIPADSWQVLCITNTTMPSPDEQLRQSSGFLARMVLYYGTFSPRAEAGLGCFFFFSLFFYTAPYYSRLWSTEKSNTQCAFFFFSLLKPTFIIANLFLLHCVAGDRYQAKKMSPLLTMGFPSLLNFK